MEQDRGFFSFKDLVMPEFKKSTITNERQAVIKEFVDEINKERPVKYKDKNGKIKTLPKVTPRAVAIKLGHIKDLQELYYFLSNCRDYRSRNGSFSKCFFGSLKPLA
jgi:hypothetical protein